MSQKLPIKSAVTVYGGSTFMLLPPAIREHLELEKGSKCKIELYGPNRLQVVFE